VEGNRLSSADVTTDQRWRSARDAPFTPISMTDGLGYAFFGIDAWCKAADCGLEEEEKESRRETTVDVHGDHRPSGTSRARTWTLWCKAVVAAYVALALMP